MLQIPGVCAYSTNIFFVYSSLLIILDAVYVSPAFEIHK